MSDTDNKQTTGAPSIPKSISLAQFRDANVAWLRALGVNPDAVYFPVIIMTDKVILQVPPGYVPEGRVQGTSSPSHPQGDEYAELRDLVEIQVVS